MFNAIPTFPVLRSNKLILRQLVRTDTPAIHELRTNEEVNKMVGREGSGELKDSEGFIEKISATVSRREGFYWGLCLKETGRLVGTACLYNLKEDIKAVELGYELLPQWQGKGLMTEATSKVIEFAFNQLGAEIVKACPSKYNLKSIAVLERAGFTQNGDCNNTVDEKLLTFTLKRAQFI